GGVALGADALSPRHAGDRVAQDAQVEAERLVVDVPDVHVELLVPRERVPAVGLGPAGDAGADLVAAGVLGGVAGEIAHGQWPRSDEAHVAAYDVEQRRQLVEARGAEHPPPRRGAWSAAPAPAG